MMRWIVLAAFALCAAPALAQPRIVALSEADEAAYRAAFAAADSGDAGAVRSRLTRVEDEVLVGFALGTAHAHAGRGAYSQINDWLNRHPDLSVSDDVYRRAVRIKPRRARRPHAPDAMPTRAHPFALRAPAGDTQAARRDIAAIQENLSMGAYGEARAIGMRALEGPRSGQAHWLLGLVSFHDRDYAAAAQHFESAAAWDYNDRLSRAAAFYWASRARLANGDVRLVTAHLEAAARFPMTFYGQLAEAQLGADSALRFQSPELDAQTLSAFVERYPGARRAAALAQLGRLSDVEGELRRLHGQLSPREDVTFMALAEALEAPSAQLRAADFGGPELASGYCPATTFEPAGGFVLDRALIYAIVRQESAFNPIAVSSSNARGLMQLLPSTANDMDRSRGYRRNPALLFEPAENMRLGQQYVVWLIDQFHRDGDLARVFAAYNGGPGWLQRWLQSTGETNDPLLLLETLPRQESRDYAERVLSHMSICRQKFGQPRPELDALASGRPATYRPLDVNAYAVAGAQH